MCQKSFLAVLIHLEEGIDHNFRASFCGSVITASKSDYLFCSIFVLEKPGHLTKDQLAISGVATSFDNHIFNFILTNVGIFLAFSLTCEVTFGLCHVDSINEVHSILEQLSGSDIVLELSRHLTQHNIQTSQESLPL